MFLVHECCFGNIYVSAFLSHDREVIVNDMAYGRRLSALMLITSIRRQMEVCCDISSLQICCL
jgi:hypothetical protein